MFAARSLPHLPHLPVPATRSASTQAAAASATFALLKAAEAHLARATSGLWEVSQLDRRGDRAQALARLAEALAPGELQLARLAQATPLDRRDPQAQALRRELAAARQVQVLASAGARFLSAYAPSQGPQEAPILEAGWTRRLCGEAQAQIQQLAARPQPQGQQLAALLAASAPEAVQPLLSVEDLPAELRRAITLCRLRMGASALSLPQWLALRLFAHPDSGAAAALRAQERLQALHLDAAEATTPLLRSLGGLKLGAVATAARLPGLGLADPQARYHLALSAEGHLPLEEVLREGGEWLVRRTLSASTSAQQARAELGLGEPPQDRLLCLQAGHAQAGPLRALRLDLFQPPGAVAREDVLLLPGQVFQVCEEGDEILPLEQGQSLRVKLYTLRKQAEDRGSGLPGTLPPWADAGMRAWELASVL